MGVLKIGLQIQTRRPRIKLFANFGKLGCIISVKNDQLSCQNPLEVSSLRVFQNIFPLAKVSFAKGKLFGAGRHPTGPEWRE